MKKNILFIALFAIIGLNSCNPTLEQLAPEIPEFYTIEYYKSTGEKVYVEHYVYSSPEEKYDSRDKYYYYCSGNFYKFPVEVYDLGERVKGWALSKGSTKITYPAGAYFLFDAYNEQTKQFEHKNETMGVYHIRYSNNNNNSHADFPVYYLKMRPCSTLKLFGVRE